MLIIDEPESHLDTANQIIMARILVRCVNAGMKVLITTHSDYIIKEFNNLIMLSHEFPEKKSFLHHHKKEYTADNFLNIESVKAYVCGKGTLTPCGVDSRGMIMPIFDKTIDDINNISDMLDSYLPEEE
ncbi:MAG: AAA family ATPase [Gammaproteobacteria bacterium WSBS_2016_MAG_OTU1]